MRNPPTRVAGSVDQCRRAALPRQRPTARKPNSANIRLEPRLPSGSLFFISAHAGDAMSFAPNFPFDPNDPSQWWARMLARNPVQPDAPQNAAPGGSLDPDGIDDWIVPGPAPSQADHPEDWIAPGNAQTNDPYPDDWIHPSSNAATAPSTAPPPPSQQPFTAVPGLSNRPAPPDPLAAYWSLIPASRAGAMAWHPPVFLPPNPFSHENIPASAWVTPLPIFLNSPQQFPSTSPAPFADPPSAAAEGLLGGIPKMLAAPASPDFLHDSAGQGLLGGIPKLLAASASPDPFSTSGSWGLLGALKDLPPANSNAQADAAFTPDLRPYLSSDPTQFGDEDPLPDIKFVADKKKESKGRDVFNGRAFGITPPLGSLAPKPIPPIVGGPPPLAPPARATSSPSGLSSSSPGPAVTNPRSFGALIGPAQAAVPAVESNRESGNGADENKDGGESDSPVRPKINKPYSRPPNATRGLSTFVQGNRCSDCGTIAPKMYVNHVEPLVKEYYRTGTIDTDRMRSPDAVNAHCPTCSAREGGVMANFSKYMKALLGL